MSGRFAPLVPCDIEGCNALVESQVARCGYCRIDHGPAPSAVPTKRRRPANPESPKHERNT